MAGLPRFSENHSGCQKRPRIRVALHVDAGVGADGHDVEALRTGIGKQFRNQRRRDAATLKFPRHLGVDDLQRVAVTPIVGDRLAAADRRREAASRDVVADLEHGNGVGHDDFDRQKVPAAAVRTRSPRMDATIGS